VSTFMGVGAVDLDLETEPQLLLDEMVRLAAEDPLKLYATQPLHVWIRPIKGGRRVSLWADYGNAWLGEALVLAAAGVPGLQRAVLGLDHDGYGAEHVIFAGMAGGLCRLQYVYVYPDGEPNEECEPSFADVPPCRAVDVAPDGTINGVSSWAAVAALYRVPLEPVKNAGQYAAVAHEELGVIFTPFAPWWNAIDVSYPGDLGAPDLVLLDTRTAN
jgi:hypothetical protein